MADAQILFPGETLPSSVEEKDKNGDGLQRFMDTAPFEDTEVIDSQMFETDGRGPVLEAYLVNQEESLEDMESEPKIEYEKAVVLDSEDEQVDGTNSMPRTGTSCFSYNEASRLNKGSQIRSWKGQLKKTCEAELDDTGNERCSSGEINLQQLSQCDFRTKTLNYASSQEPGELSQANALDVVNKYVVHTLDLSPECQSEKIVRRKSSPISYVKGSYNLAKIIRRASNDEGKGIFSWVDNNQNDVTAGLFNKIRTPSNLKGHNRSFEKKVCNHFHNQNSCNTTDRTKIVGGNWGSNTCRDAMQSQGEVKVSAQSNVMMNNSTDTSKKEFNRKEQNLEPSVSTVDEFEMFDVGIGTQIAVEAMEALANIVPCEPICNSGHQNSGDVTKNDVLLQPSSVRENSYIQVFTRRPRRKNVTYDEVVKTVSTTSLNRMKKQKSIPNMKATRMKEGNGLHLNHLHGTMFVDATKKSSRAKKQKKSESITHKSSLTECEDINCGPIFTEHMSHEGEQSDECLSHYSTFTLQYKQRSIHCKDMVDDAIQQGILKYRRKRSNLASGQVRQSHKIKIPGSSSLFGVAKSISSNQQVQGSLQEDVTKSGLTPSLWPHPRGPRGKRRRCNVSSIQTEDVRVRAPRDFSYLPSRQASSFGQGALESIDEDAVTSIEDFKFSSSKKTCDDHPKKVCNKNSPKSSLVKELTRLGVNDLEYDLSWKNMRQRRAMAGVRVLFSQHLDKNIIEQQKKILTRLKISIATSATDATHFVADKFMRTRNMLESIALGKTVVTHLWLESCRLSHSLVDERNYILRDARKEKELGFSMPVTLSRARMQPLLKGKKVFVTPNVEPSKDMIITLVAAVRGKVVDWCSISAIAEENLDNLLILSCEQDHVMCQPLLDIGVAVCSSELILSGIVTQKLELKRHQLFKNEVSRKCCSTLTGTCDDESIRSRLYGKVYSRRRKLES